MAKQRQSIKNLLTKQAQQVDDQQLLCVLKMSNQREKVLQFLLPYGSEDQMSAKFSLQAIEKAMIDEGHLTPVHPKTGKQIPMIYQIRADNPIRLSNVIDLNYSTSAEQNYLRMENKKWFCMSIFELL